MKAGVELSLIQVAHQRHCEHMVSAASVSDVRARVCVCVCLSVCLSVCVRTRAWPVCWVSSSAFITSLLQEFRVHPRLNWELNGPMVPDLAVLITVLITEPD